MGDAKTTELKNKLDFRIHGNLSRSPHNQLRDRLGGAFSVVFTSDDNRYGTVQRGGKCYDWHINDWGDVVVYDAK